MLVEKLSGKSKKRSAFECEARMKEEITPKKIYHNSSSDEQKNTSPPSPCSPCSPKKSKSHEELNLDNYLKQALKNAPNIEEFLYLVNKKYLKGNNC